MRFLQHFPLPRLRSIHTQTLLSKNSETMRKDMSLVGLDLGCARHCRHQPPSYNTGLWPQTGTSSTAMLGQPTHRTLLPRLSTEYGKVVDLLVNHVDTIESTPTAWCNTGGIELVQLLQRVSNRQASNDSTRSLASSI